MTSMDVNILSAIGIIFLILIGVMFEMVNSLKNKNNKLKREVDDLGAAVKNHEYMISKLEKTVKDDYKELHNAVAKAEYAHRLYETCMAQMTMIHKGINTTNERLFEFIQSAVEVKKTQDELEMQIEDLREFDDRKKGMPANKISSLGESDGINGTASIWEKGNSDIGERIAAALAGGAAVVNVYEHHGKFDFDVDPRVVNIPGMSFSPGTDMRAFTKEVVSMSKSMEMGATFDEEIKVEDTSGEGSELQPDGVGGATESGGETETNLDCNTNVLENSTN